MQGSAADIIKIAMIDVNQWIVSKEVPARIIMQVHDELVLEVKSDASDDIKFDLIKIMESSVDLDVPLVVDAAVGLNWDEAH
jgi:DNA polymerase-1